MINNICEYCGKQKNEYNICECENCYNCKFQAKLYSHPCVDQKPMSNFLNYVCTVFLKESGSIVLNSNKSLCEMFTRPKEIKPKIVNSEFLDAIEKSIDKSFKENKEYFTSGQWLNDVSLKIQEKREKGE